MTDFVTLQNDIYYALLSRDKLATINVKQYRKMVIQSELDMKLIYLTIRGGANGAGILVEMPTLTVNKPNVVGPVLEVEFPILVMEQPTINMQQNGGTMISAETICQTVLETLHHFSLGQGALRTLPTAVTPATEYRGVIAYRCHLGFTSAGAPTQRTGLVQLSMNADLATMTCNADPTAQIFYTLDGSFPTSTYGGNPQSQLYQNSPVSAPSGTVIRACAYVGGKIGGSLVTAVFP
jgi:hypothetical protein